MAKGPDGYDTDPEVKKQQRVTDKEFTHMILADLALTDYKADMFDVSASILVEWLSVDLTDESQVSPLAVRTHQFLVETGQFPIHDKRIS